MLTSAELVWLLAAVAKADHAAFERLYAATRAKLYGVVLRILRRKDLADEVMQETYLKIWNSAGGFDPASSSPITWMVTVARNRAIDQVRKADVGFADYLGVGPIFATPTKPDVAAPMGVEGLAAVRAISALPILAIGGISETNAAETIAAGADGVASALPELSEGSWTDSSRFDSNDRHR